MGQIATRSPQRPEPRTNTVCRVTVRSGRTVTVSSPVHLKSDDSRAFPGPAGGPGFRRSETGPRRLDCGVRRPNISPRLRRTGVFSSVRKIHGQLRPYFGVHRFFRTDSLALARLESSYKFSARDVKTLTPRRERIIIPSSSNCSPKQKNLPATGTTTTCTDWTVSRRL